MEKSIGTVRGRSRGQRNSFRPPGCPVDDGEEVGVTTRPRKRTHEINVDMGEPPHRNRDGFRNRAVMFKNFSSWAL
jgi:hypothetical protein